MDNPVTKLELTGWATYLKSQYFQTLFLLVARKLPDWKPIDYCPLQKFEVWECQQLFCLIISTLNMNWNATIYALVSYIKSAKGLYNVLINQLLSPFKSITCCKDVLQSLAALLFMNFFISQCLPLFSIHSLRIFSWSCLHQWIKES